MARMTKKLQKQIMEWTNVCFRQALLEEYPEFFAQWTETAKKDTYNMKSLLWQAGLPINSTSINDRYLSHLLKLSGDQLSLIVEADQKGHVKRSPVTIHAILDEMLHRSARGQYD